jgi:ABC-type transport system involved in multi-copper enzyme maturation permease subunit
VNRGLLIKSVREVWVTTVLIGLAVGLFEALLAYIIPNFFEELTGHLASLKFVENIFKGLLGSDLGGAIGPEAMASLPWVHPIVLALVWAHGIILCTRLPAEEIDRGTIGMLLALPISRTRIYVCDSVVWMCAGAVVVAMGLAGSLIGARFVTPEMRSDPSTLVIVVIHLYCLYLAVAGVACLVSSLSNRRGRAGGAVFAIVLVSFLLNFLAFFWVPAKNVAFLSVLHYYQPLRILRESAWPTADMLTLLAVGLVFWIAGAVAFARRDICTSD